MATYLICNMEPITNPTRRQGCEIHVRRPLRPPSCVCAANKATNDSQHAAWLCIYLYMYIGFRHYLARHQRRMQDHCSMQMDLDNSNSGMHLTKYQVEEGQSDYARVLDQSLGLLGVMCLRVGGREGPPLHLAHRSFEQHVHRSGSVRWYDVEVLENVGRDRTSP